MAAALARKPDFMALAKSWASFVQQATPQATVAYALGLGDAVPPPPLADAFTASARFAVGDGFAEKSPAAHPRRFAQRHLAAVHWQ